MDAKRRHVIYDMSELGWCRGPAFVPGGPDLGDTRRIWQLTVTRPPDTPASPPKSPSREGEAKSANGSGPGAYISLP